MTEATVTAAEFPLTNYEPSANWRPGQKKARPKKSVDHTIRHGIRSMIRSVVKREDFDIADLSTLADLQADLAAAQQTAVDNIRSQGYSWSEVADGLGCSKANVIKRFGVRRESKPKPCNPTAELAPGQLVIYAASLDGSVVYVGATTSTLAERMSVHSGDRSSFFRKMAADWDRLVWEELDDASEYAAISRLEPPLANIVHASSINRHTGKPECVECGAEFSIPEGRPVSARPPQRCKVCR